MVQREERYFELPLKNMDSFKREVCLGIEKYLHFKNHVSLRVETTHAKLKKYLQVSTSDFHQVKGKICLTIDNDFQEIKTQLSNERLRIPHSCNVSFFREFN